MRKIYKTYNKTEVNSFRNDGRCAIPFIGFRLADETGSDIGNTNGGDIGGGFGGSMVAFIGDDGLGVLVKQSSKTFMHVLTFAESIMLQQP